MSIINDALKKIQSDREKKPSVPSTPQMDPATVKTIATEKDIQQVSTVKRKPGPSRIIILGFGAVIIIFSLFFDIITQKIILPIESTTPHKDQIAANSTPTAVDNKPTSPKKKLGLLPFQSAPSEEGLILNGIVYSGDDGKKSFVLINNEIYEVGESVDGKKVMNITRKEVTLDNNGEPLILKLRNYSKSGQ